MTQDSSVLSILYLPYGRSDGSYGKNCGVTVKIQGEKVRFLAYAGIKENDRNKRATG